MSEKIKGETLSRKDEHLDIAFNNDICFTGKKTGFECVNIIHKALPEIDYSSVKTKTEFMGKSINAPIMISAMTGGTERAKTINIKLAKAAKKLNIPICLGSQRAMIEDKGKTETYSVVRENAGNTPVVGNIGVVQLKQYGPEAVLDAVEQIDADGIAVHINPEQEVVQYEGDTDFTGCLMAIGDLVKHSHSGKIHVMVKEIGHGIDYDTAKSLRQIGVEYLDVAGAGGTSWTKIESLRKKSRLLGFDNLGIPTVVSLLMAKKAGWGSGNDEKHKLISSGGVRSGIDVSKSLLLGADYAGSAMPILVSDNPAKLISEWMEQLKAVMFLCGAENIDALKSCERYAISGWVNEWLGKLYSRKL